MQKTFCDYCDGPIDSLTKNFGKPAANTMDAPTGGYKLRIMTSKGIGSWDALDFHRECLKKIVDEALG